MKLVKLNCSELVQEKAYDGLLHVKLVHKIESTAATANYIGPRIDPVLWHQILSFFDWTNTEHHSESQVRLYVNPAVGRWAAWAFPQEARTGMSARELAGEEFDRQRARFDASWIYAGTVHHHCSGGAHQSSTDESNERTQDGLHITVGKVGSSRLDLHARFYVNSAQFTPDLAQFWDIGKEIAAMTPASVHNDIALHQMTTPPAVMSFPDDWKTNVIEIKTVTPSGVVGQGFFPGYPAGTYGSYGGSSGVYRSSRTKWNSTAAERAEEVVVGVLNKSQGYAATLTDLSEFLVELGAAAMAAPLLDAVAEWNVSLDQICDGYDRMFKRACTAYNTTTPSDEQILAVADTEANEEKLRAARIKASIAANKGGNGDTSIYDPRYSDVWAGD